MPKYSKAHELKQQRLDLTLLWRELLKLTGRCAMPHGESCEKIIQAFINEGK